MAYTTIDKPTDYFNTVLWSGNSSTQSVTGVGFQPDFVWVKNRSISQPHIVQDIVRGKSGSNFQYLFTDRTDAEAVQPDNDGIQSFDTDGFSMNHTDSGGWNESGSNYVGWNWKAGGSASSNTDGSITSSVSANTTAGFSIVSYTGNGTGGATIGHGLGVSPSWIVTKKRSATGSWVVYHKSQGATKYGILDTTASFGTSSSLWNDTEPTSSVFSVGTDADTNGSSATFIAYCFAEKKGYSKFGSYVGNGTSGVDGAGDGTFVYTGFKPAMIIIKPSSAVENWQILDNKRPGFNESDNLAPNNSAAENTGNDFVDLVSNGFKLRSGTYSASGVTYIYMAFAENPFVTSTGIPTTAR